VKALVDIVLAYGQSDEYSFIFQKSTTMFDRRASKLSTTVATMFTAEYCMQWPLLFPDRKLERPYPTFDGRCICYPEERILRDYLSWRQADCHINNLYNTTFWNMVLKGGQSTTEAEAELKGTMAADKNEILFSRFGINYNKELQMFRKGTVIYRAYDGAGEGQGENGDGNGSRQTVATSRTQMEKERKMKMKATIAVEHVDIIGGAFWEARPYILASK
jgi:tRNA(His) guanylyltransferase